MNFYCERAGLSEAPSVEDFSEKSSNLFHLMIVALLERGQPMVLEDIALRLITAGVESKSNIVMSLQKAWHGQDPVSRDPDGRFALNLSSPDLRYTLWRMGLVQPGSSKPKLQAESLQMAVIRAFPEEERPQAVSLLNMDARSIRTFSGENLRDFPDSLMNYDVIAGLFPRNALIHMEMDPDRWRLVDLKPPKKSLKVNSRGRTLKITPELLITSSTGISRPLGDPKKMRKYLAENDTSKLIRRLEADVRSLYALLQYGALHGFLRLRWGFIDDILPCHWAPLRQPNLYELLRNAIAKQQRIEIVLGNSPGWEDPWSRAVRGTVTHLEMMHVTFVPDHGVFQIIDRRDIQAVRIVE